VFLKKRALECVDLEYAPLKCERRDERGVRWNKSIREAYFNVQ